jgi:TonB family protein
MKSCRILGVWIAGCTALWTGNVSKAAAPGRTPVQVEQTVQANYPPSLLLQGVSSGEVWVMITVDETGALTDAMVTRYTHPEFASEALHTLRSCRFSPAMENGIPVSVRTELRLSFESTGQIMTLDAGSTLQQLTAFSYRPDYVERLCSPTQLDRVPAPTETVSPRHPGHAPNGPIEGGRAVLDFIIDEQGVPRMPVLISSTNRSFANAAVEALSRWRFTPPIRQGKPIAVKVRQEFVFPTAEAPEAAPGSATKRLSAHTAERNPPTL